MHKGLTAALTLAGALAAGPLAAQDWSKVRIATEGAYPPWNSTDSSGNLVGFEIDLANELCARMQVECEIVAQDWDGIIPALQAGKYDVIMAGMSITDERDEVIDFSENYADTPAFFATTEDSDLADLQVGVERIDLSDVDADEQAALDQLSEVLAGKTIGVQTATTHANFLGDYLGDVVTIRTYDTQENLTLDLEVGRVDAALAAASYWQPLLDSGEAKNLVLVGPAMTGDVFGKGVGVGLREDDDELREMFNAAIQEVKADGTLEDLAVHWFGFNAATQ